MDASTRTDGITLSSPSAEDGLLLHDLVRQCKPLDENSLYCNLLQCFHFAGTSAVAKQGGVLVGMATGYLVPERRDTLFVWQMAVAASVRGRGLAKALLMSILQRPVCSDVRYMEASVIPQNQASRAVFSGLAGDLNTHCNESVLFEQDRHFHGRHETELLLKLGPFSLPKTEGTGV